MYAAGLWVYLRATEARDRIGRWGLIALAVFLIVVYLASAGTAPVDPGALHLGPHRHHHPDCLGWWADRHRRREQTR